MVVNEVISVFDFLQLESKQVVDYFDIYYQCFVELLAKKLHFDQKPH